MPCLIPLLLIGAAMWWFAPALALTVALTGLLLGLGAIA